MKFKLEGNIVEIIKVFGARVLTVYKAPLTGCVWSQAGYFISLSFNFPYKLRTKSTISELP